ncbi:MAG: hypothetical protein LUC83_07630, partial [Clostridiales bacterium]|nr:hypothetical protein [Clostridiales bacterium]
MTLKKRNRKIASVAVALAAVLLIGGATITYLSSTSSTVVNSFNTNEIEVNLNETGATEGEDGKFTKDDYKIIPGTSEEKDPTVTLTSTVDSYLYVLVYENNPTFTYIKGEDAVTENIIDRDIADGWKELGLAYDKDSDGDGTYDTYSDEILEKFGLSSSDVTDATSIVIYYREVAASKEVQTFHVLDGDIVSYSSEITDLSSYTDVYLAFAAYAIQQSPFSSAASALTQTTVSTTRELAEALSSGAAATLSDNMAITDTDLNSAIAAATTATGSADIDLNGQTLTITGDSGIDLASQSLSLTNGTVAYTGGSTVAVAIESGSSLTLDNVTLNVDSTKTGATSAINIEGSSDNATLTIRNSTINSKEYFALSTNASTPASSDVTVVIENSTLSTSVCGTDPETTGILFNVPGTLTITNSTITGGSQGVIVRGGTANITDSTIIATITGDGADVSSFTTTMGYLTGTSNWGTGNSLPAAALVAGNHSASAYAYDTT